MPFEKGQSGNPNGRPKGTPNKVTGDIKQVLADVLNGISPEQILKDLNSLKPYERLKMIDSLASYVIPRAKEAEPEITSHYIVKLPESNVA